MVTTIEGGAGDPVPRPEGSSERRADRGPLGGRRWHGRGTFVILALGLMAFVGAGPVPSSATGSGRVENALATYSPASNGGASVNLAPVVQALHETGYTGLLEVAHVPHLKRDPGERIVDAWSVGFLKGLIAAAAR